jgi:hypothetical protein
MASPGLTVALKIKIIIRLESGLKIGVSPSCDKLHPL